MTQAAVWAVGFGQCVGWGVLYYAFGVLVVPVEQQLGAPRWMITGAFSMALLTSAFAAPVVGRWTDRGHGPAVMQAGGLIAAGLLALWAWLPTVLTSYIAWAGLGLCMAAVLYEPVFAQVGRVVTDGRERIRAIATITILGGLASTVALPATAWLIEAIRMESPRFSCSPATLAVVTVLVNRRVFRRMPETEVEGPASLRRLAPPDSLARLAATRVGQPHHHVRIFELRERGTRDQSRAGVDRSSDQPDHSRDFGWSLWRDAIARQVVRDEPALRAGPGGVGVGKSRTTSRRLGSTRLR